MSRYQKMFERLAQKNEAAFIPFVVLCDPNKEMSKKIICRLIDAGADGLELGIAFSDPLADGPIIQKADLRALKSGATIKSALSLVKEIRNYNGEIPIGILTYANLVFKNGLDRFYNLCSESGIDSVLVADVPLLEAPPFCEAALKNHIDPVLLAPINLPLTRCADIAKWGRGYTYVVTRKGVTGINTEVSLAHGELLRVLKENKAPPPLFGFGISNPNHVKISIKEGAAGVISGSKVVSIIEENLFDSEQMFKELESFVKTMKNAAKF